MKVQEFGKPEITFSWLLKADAYSKERYKKTLDTAEGKQQLVDAILLCLDQGKELRIGTDGLCLILEANEADSEYTDASYQYVDEDHFIGEFDKNGNYPDYYADVRKDQKDGRNN